MTVIVWQRTSDSLRQTPLVNRLLLDGDVTDRANGNAPMIVPVHEVGDAAAAALVPVPLSRAVSHNGVPVSAGMFVLRHADRIDFATSTFWVSIAAQAAHDEYKPEQHGQDVFCFITKARLKQDEPITICPGRPEKSCGMIYKRAAWEMALKADTFKCPNCQFDPRQPTWSPPEEKPPTMLDDLFRILSEERTE